MQLRKVKPCQNYNGCINRQDTCLEQIQNFQLLWNNAINISHNASSNRKPEVTPLNISIQGVTLSFVSLFLFQTRQESQFSSVLSFKTFQPEAALLVEVCENFPHSFLAVVVFIKRISFAGVFQVISVF